MAQDSTTANGLNQPQLADLLDFSPTIIYCAVPSGDFRITYISNNLRDILGHAPQDFYADDNFWHGHIHPEDRQRVFTNLPQLFTQDRHIVDYRFQHKDGHYLWLHDQLRLIRNADGEAINIVGSLTDITELKKIENEILQYSNQMEKLVEQRTTELVVARDEALAAEKAMSSFLSNMSHELRTPLHGILSFASFGIKKHQRVPLEKLGQYFTEIHDSGEHLLVLINDLLDLSKLRAGKMIYDFQLACLDGVIQEVSRELRLLAKERKIWIDHCCQVESSEVVMDSTKIAQVIRNLLSNAIKFSPDNSIININIDDAANNGFRIRVSDQGVGIPEDEFEYIFDAFSQSSKTRTNAGGTGLGLPICKEIIEQGHGGVISACNKADCGAQFTVMLPAHGKENR